ncbi:hypothetical protein OPV22_023096 [Ensete ventricosum]|uniref:Histone acetyltransferase n=1 Tax=Ensete ventricosum TaxID=4639 RepID=A0AAV8QR55_ENSVE|nr:hypothetical protein OPV22_023096 [Ensete ventricosum]
MALRLLHLPAKSGRSGSTVALPLEVGSRVMCQWRDQKPHPGTVIERRKIPNDYEYYVHYAEFNRRLDEWVKLEQHDLGTVETGLDEKVDDKVTSLKMTRHQKQKIDETHVEHGHEELDAASLREHEEFTKVKNIAKIELGRYEIVKPIHFSFMSTDNDISDIDIYIDVTLSILQVMRYREVAPFLCLRLMARRTRFMGRIFVIWLNCCHMVGYFSKFSLKWHFNSSSLRYGKFLIAFSYELSKEGQHLHQGSQRHASD